MQTYPASRPRQLIFFPRAMSCTVHLVSPSTISFSSSRRLRILSRLLRPLSRRCPFFLSSVLSFHVELPSVDVSGDARSLAPAFSCGRPEPRRRPLAGLPPPCISETQLGWRRGIRQRPSAAQRSRRPFPLLPRFALPHPSRFLPSNHHHALFLYLLFDANARPSPRSPPPVFSRFLFARERGMVMIARMIARERGGGGEGGACLGANQAWQAGESV